MIIQAIISSEALMKSVIHSSLVAIKNPNDYEARSNIMWTATWALTLLLPKAKQLIGRFICSVRQSEVIQMQPTV